MKRLLLVAMVCAAVVVPACAQRGGSRGGGFSGHAGGASMGVSRGGSSSSAHAGFSSAPRGSFAPSRSFGAVQRGPAVQAGARPNFYNRRPAYAEGYGVNRDHRFYRRGVGAYGAGVWVAPDYLAYPDDFGYDDAAGDQGVGPQGDGPGPYVDAGPYVGQGDPEPPYQAPAAIAARPAQSLAQEDSVTLVFKDGRPVEHIRNYMLTRKTLYVQEPHRREIAVEDLDLAATAKANRAAGVDFQLPTETH